MKKRFAPFFIKFVSTILLLVALQSRAANFYSIHPQICDWLVLATSHPQSLAPEASFRLGQILSAVRPIKSQATMKDVASLVARIVELSKEVSLPFARMAFQAKSLDLNELQQLADDPVKFERLLDYQASQCRLETSRPVTPQGEVQNRESLVSVFILDPGPSTGDPVLQAVKNRIIENNLNLVLEEFGHSLQLYDGSRISATYSTYLMETGQPYDNEAEVAAYIYEVRGFGATLDLWHRYESRSPLLKWLKKKNPDLSSD